MEITLSLLLIILILYWIYLYQKYKIEHFTEINSEDLPTDIWMYWENKDSNEKPTYIKMCYETILNNVGNRFKVHLLDEKTIYDYLPKLRRDLDRKLKRIPMKADYIRYSLLYKYGGIWLDSDVIVFRNLDDLIEKLKEVEYVGFGCHNNGLQCTDIMNGYPKPANWVMISRKKSKLLKYMLKDADELLNKNNSSYFEKYYHSLGRNLLWDCIQKVKQSDENWDYLHMSSKCVERDSKGNKITNSRSMSIENIDEYCSSKIYFLPIYNTAPGFPDWFLKMSKKEILNSNILVSKFFRKAYKNFLIEKS